MTDDNVKELIHLLQTGGDDGQHVEAKAAQGKIPSGVRDTLSSFANTSGGGVILLGVAEREAFKPIGVQDAAAFQRRLSEIARQDMNPALEPRITMHDIDGAMLIACAVDELPIDHKPCFYKGKGHLNGCFRCVGDQDVRLDNAQVQALIAGRAQPRDDISPAASATVADLDAAALAAYTRRLRERNPRVFEGKSDEQILLRTSVMSQATGAANPTVGGLLALGPYPQEFLPQVNISLVVLPTVSGEPEGGTRFLENRRIDGSIPEMLLSALQALRRILSQRAIIDAAGGRIEEPEYPIEALREAIANALVHRDLSAVGLGTQVQIEVYPDRIEISNPGGLYGGVSIESLGEYGVSSSRNSHLVRILEDVQTPDGRMVIENRASGIRAMAAALKSAGLGPPEFDDQLSHFVVRFRNSALIDAEIRSWIEAIGASGLSPNQHHALAIMRRSGEISNESFRRATGVDSRVATNQLRQLVESGLAKTDGYGRWTNYRLGPKATTDAAGEPLPEVARRVLESIRGETSRRELEERTGLRPATVIKWLNYLETVGKVRATAPPRSRNRRYVTVEGPEKLF